MADSHLSFFSHLFFIKDPFVYLILTLYDELQLATNYFHLYIHVPLQYDSQRNGIYLSTLQSKLHCVICFGQRDVRKCDIGRGRKSACLMSLIFCCPETTCEEAQASLLRRRDQGKQERQPS